MKKIVGILAAAAVAVSAFAVDFSAGIQLKGSLFNYEDGGNISALSLKSANSKDDKPFIFSISDERAGGQVKIYDKDEGKAADPKSAMVASAFNIWFKPFNGMKIDLGNTDLALNCETVTYWRGKVWGSSDWGYKATYEYDAFSVAVYLDAGGNWFEKKAAVAVAETALKVAYNADFGNISFIFDGKDTFDTLIFGLGYKGSFDALSFFVDAEFTKAATNGIGVDFDVKYSANGFGIEAYAGMITTDLTNFTNTMRLPVFFKASYALNGGSLYAKFVTDDVLHVTQYAVANYRPSQIEAGYDGNLGCISYNIAAVYDLTAKGFSVPFWVRLGF